MKPMLQRSAQFWQCSLCLISAGCQAPVASASTKELRLKGSSFLRRHASRHGIANASRKLTAQVIRELSQHYYTAHKVVVADDDLQVNIQKILFMWIIFSNPTLSFNHKLQPLFKF